MKLREITAATAERVDREAGVIYGVKILGRESKNGRIYSDKALQEAAQKYKGVDVNVNHPDRSKANSERKVEDGFGWLEQIEVKSDGVYGNLHYLKEHPQAPLIVEAVERKSTRFGLSHNAEGRAERKNGKNVVESIERVHSVDVVQTPATTRGMLESTGVTIREALGSEESAIGKGILKLLEDSALLPPETYDEPMPEMPAEMEEDPERKVKCAVVELLTAALDMEGDLRAVVLQVMQTAQTILKGLPEPAAAPAGQPGDQSPGADGKNGDQGGANSGQQPPADGNQNPATSSGQQNQESPTNQGGTQPQKNSTDPNSAGQANADPNDPSKKRKPPMSESTAKTVEERLNLLEQENRELRDELADRDLRESCQKLLKDGKREVTDIRVKALMSLEDDDGRKALIETWEQIYEAAPVPSRPARSAPRFGGSSGTGESGYPADSKAFVSSIK